MTFPYMPAQVAPEKVEERLAICRQCEFRGTGYGVGIEVCKACNCPLLSKTKFQKSNCPKGKW